MRLTAGLDSGPVCLTAEEPIAPRRHLRHARRAAGGASAASCWCRRSTTGRRFAEQDEAGATYAEKITAEDRLLDRARRAATSSRGSSAR